jgi:hypothetical protein
MEKEIKSNDCTSERRSELEKAHEALQREVVLLQTGGRGMYVCMCVCMCGHQLFSYPSHLISSKLNFTTR